jgi:hypothetical protein
MTEDQLKKGAEVQAEMKKWYAAYDDLNKIQTKYTDRVSDAMLFLYNNDGSAYNLIVKHIEKVLLDRTDALEKQFEQL